MKEVNFEVEDITAKMSKGTQILLARRIPQTILEYNEERPCETDLKSRLVRGLKKLALRIAWQYIYKHPMGYVNALFFRHYGLLGSGLSHKIYGKLEEWKSEIYLHCISRAVYFGITAKESELDKATEKLSNLIEFSMGPEVIKGSISGAMQMKLYRMPEDKEQKYVVLAYLHTNRGFSEMVHELMATPDGRKRLDRLYIIQEGGMPREIA